MALEDFLRAADFVEFDLFGQWAKFEYPIRYGLFDSSENALIQLFPSDRPRSWFCAVLNYSKGLLDFGYYPRQADGLGYLYSMYCTSGGVRVWGKASGEVFTSNPWARGGQPSTNDVGVPGTAQFLTEYPFCQPTSLGGNASPIGPSQRLVIAPAVVQPSEYEEESLHVRRVNI